MPIYKSPGHCMAERHLNNNTLPTKHQVKTQSVDQTTRRPHCHSTTVRAILWLSTNPYFQVALWCRIHEII